MPSATERNIAFEVLNRGKIERVHETSLHIVERIGVRVGGERSVALLKKAGCAVDADGRVKIPRKRVEQALQTAPKKLVLYDRAGKPAMEIDQRRPVYFGCHSDMLAFVEPFTGKVRDFVKADIATLCRIADALPNIHFVLSVGLCRDVSPKIQTQTTFIETLKHFGKTINFSTNDVESLQEVIDIAAAVAGGHRRLQEKPFVFNYCEPLPPLTHPEESTEKLIISAANRIPVVYMPYCMMGGTAPMSFAGALAQCNAEILSGLVIHQLAGEGAPFIYGAMPSIMDMKTTVGSYGAVEFHLLVAAASEIAAFYGLPFYGTAGCTDARTMDAQAVTEATMGIFSTLLSKANLIHDVGVSDHCNSVNPALVVLCDEIIEMLKHYTQGVPVDDAGLCLDVIETVGPTGAYLDQDHTFEHFHGVFYPTLFSREMSNPDESQVTGKIRDKMRELIERPVADPLPGDLLSELDRIAERLTAR